MSLRPLQLRLASVNQGSGGVPMYNARSAGLVLALVSAAAFGTSGALAGSLLAAGWTPGAAVLARLALAAAALTVPAALALRGRWQLLRARAGTVTLYGVLAVAGAQFAYFNAVSHLSVGVALLLEYQGIVLVVAWLWLRHGRRPRPLVLAGSAVAIAGLALVLDVVGGFRLDGVGVLWGLVAAVGLAVYFVLASDDAEPLPPIVLSCAALWVGALVLVAGGLAGLVPLRTSTADVELAGHQVSWLVPVLGVSLVAAALAYVLGIVGARLLGATLASFVGLAEVLFAVGFAWLFVGQVPTPVQAIGGVVVIAGVALVRLGELRAPSVAPAPEPTPLTPEPPRRWGPRARARRGVPRAGRSARSTRGRTRRRRARPARPAAGPRPAGRRPAARRGRAARPRPAPAAPSSSRRRPTSGPPACRSGTPRRCGPGPRARRPASRRRPRPPPGEDRPMRWRGTAPAASPGPRRPRRRPPRRAAPRGRPGRRHRSGAPATRGTRSPGGLGAAAAAAADAGAGRRTRPDRLPTLRPW